ncbi:hypothetical protein [Candidatus Mycoplasma haematominutum]|uniref:Uncharacterized protein n=1 Tax=Candidatus Mycoplasma haematominutum 'Birmingham 1' TaxID=1116213 RepID=G8C2Z8_9MOLU|nr:hypothetical protein [Candidatus Mycoplasma haematominutum]CCE66696.1 hypothetical protein MHM_01780 [Candidatus Mycoplasma haematominutum 'Birmingham 1']
MPKKAVSFKINKSTVLAMDKLNLHEKFTKENFLNLCSLRWSEWGRWRRFFVIAGAIAAIVVSAPSFVMVLPCVTVFYLISCTIKNAVEIVANWKWGPIFPKKRIKKDEILTEMEEEEPKDHAPIKNNKWKKIDSFTEDEIENSDDSFLDSLESINGDEEDTAGEESEGELDEFELPEGEETEDESEIEEEDIEIEELEEDLLLDDKSMENSEESSKSSQEKTLR